MSVSNGDLVVPGQIQSPAGSFALTSTFPYVKLKEYTVRIRAEFIGFKTFVGDPVLSQPQSLGFVHLRKLEQNLNIFAYINHLKQAVDHSFYSRSGLIFADLVYIHVLYDSKKQHNDDDDDNNNDDDNNINDDDDDNNNNNNNNNNNYNNYNNNNNNNNFPNTSITHNWYIFVMEAKCMTGTRY